MPHENDICVHTVRSKGHFYILSYRTAYRFRALASAISWVQNVDLPFDEDDFHDLFDEVVEAHKLEKKEP